MGARLSVLGVVVFALCGPLSAWGAAETLRIPIVLDYPFIRAVFVYQAFTEAGEKAVPMREEDDCIQVEIWAPEVSSEGAYLKVTGHIRTSAGIPLADDCLGRAEWEGYIEVIQRVRFDPITWILRFETVDSRLYTLDRKRTTVSAVLWNFIKGHVHPFLDQVSIDVSSPMASLKALLPTVFSGEAKNRAERMLESIRADQIQVGKDAIRIPLLMEVEPLALPPAPSPTMTAAEVERFVRSWEGWDAFLIFEIGSLFDEPITPDERAIIRDTIVENRQAFAKVLTDENIGSGFIEAQFRETWEQLAPIFRKYLGRKPSPSLLTLLAFFTASDALSVLTELSARLDLEISRDGLLRLAGLIRSEGADKALDYDYAMSPELRRFLGFGPPLEESGPALEVDELDLPDAAPGEPPENSSGLWLFQGVSPAFARQNATLDHKKIQAWLPPKQDIDAYLNRVRQLLEEAAERFRHDADERHKPLFVPLVLATAWQETCWRQFIIKNRKLTYLRSYNRTSVGIMQINERVWRGIYRRESLRWNIHYNAAAGCEILSLYLRDKAVLSAQTSGALDLETLACGVYAMYNSGPGDFKRFLKRKQEGVHYKTDKLFNRKFRWTRNKQFDELAHCISP